MKRSLVAIGLLLALAAGAALLAWNSIDLIVAWTLEHYGPDVTGVSVKVREVKISPRDGRGVVRGLELGNPPGFSAPRAARFGEVRVHLEPATLANPVVRIRELVVDAPVITYERGDRNNNLEVIQKRIEGYAKRASATDGIAPVAEVRERKRRFTIDRLVIKSTRVTMTTRGLRGQGISFELPDIEMRDLGRREGGLTASEAANAVTVELQRRIAQRALTNLDALRRGGVEGALDALKGLVR